MFDSCRGHSPTRANLQRSVSLGFSDPCEDPTGPQFPFFDRNTLAAILNLHLQPLPREANFVRGKLYERFREIRPQGTSWSDEGIFDWPKRFE